MEAEPKGENIIGYLRFIEKSFKLSLELPEDIMVSTYRSFEHLAKELEWITSDYQLAEMTIIFLRDMHKKEFKNLEQKSLLEWLVPYQNSGLFTIRS
jgi:hypothetical protein